MSVAAALSPAPFPAAPATLEEVCAAGPRDMAAALRFALSRRPRAGASSVLLAAPRAWLGEYGRPYGPGLGGTALVLAATATGVEALWAMEQALRSGAVALALGVVEEATLAQTRRLDFAARDGGAVGLVLRARGGGLSAARRRWRVAAAAGAPHSDDARAPGPSRLWAELTRSRSEPPGGWMLEQDDETHRLRLADRLAGDGLVAIGRPGLAA